MDSYKTIPPMDQKRKRVKGFIKDPGTILRLSKEEASTYIDYLK